MPTPADLSGTYQSASGVRIVDAHIHASEDGVTFELRVFRTMGGEQPPIRGRLAVSGMIGVAKEDSGCVRTFSWSNPDRFTITEEGCSRRAATAGTYQRR